VKRFIVTIGVLALLTGVCAPAQAATPVPGRFCKNLDIGKKVKTEKYGIVLCKKDGDRARWR
jgi:hypothetical protein